MSVIDTLIFDRTQSDITNDTDKAYIDYGDLNRIEEAVQYLSNILNTYGYPNTTNNKTDWNMAEFRKQEDCTRIKQNYIALKNAYVSKFTVPNFEWQTIEEANNIEKILVDIEKIIKNMEQEFIYSGVSNSGQQRTWQQRFRRKYIKPIVSSTWYELSQTYWYEVGEELWTEL